ncbi:endonuclease/exonuclease/phosphatase family protein [Dactylosporangium sp. NPDC049742]|uniref:endonuclease/exonuclease/phosphatase family protein n=1 Tax=Dactylosporangium sp. NPDC049742 TaxID=3154737 RepID=UPI003435F3F4
MTLLSYNILTGASGGRLDAVCEVIDAAAPDVAAVQELRGDPPLAARTGMRLHVAPPRTGQPVGLLVAPRLRVLRHGAVPGSFHHGAAWVELDTAAGPLTVVSAHLFPYWGRIRLYEARLLAAFAGRRERVVLMGDFNSLSPSSGPPGDVRPRHRTWFGRGGVDTRAMALLARRGLVDVFQAVGEGPGWTVPTALGGEEFTRARLDYILASPAAAGDFTTCRVVTGGGTATASDHFPVLATCATDPAGRSAP